MALDNSQDGSRASRASETPTRTICHQGESWPKLPSAPAPNPNSHPGLKVAFPSLSHTGCAGNGRDNDRAARGGEVNLGELSSTPAPSAGYGASGQRARACPPTNEQNYPSVPPSPPGPRSYPVQSHSLLRRSQSPVAGSDEQLINPSRSAFCTGHV